VVKGVKRLQTPFAAFGDLKNPPPDEEKLQYTRRERGSGEFTRTIVLPDKVDEDRIDATLENGILTVRLPKSEATLPRQIAVK
jgi:HSP20 family protein